MRPNGEANSTSPASSSQPFTSGRNPKPVASVPQQPAGGEQVHQPADAGEDEQRHRQHGLRPAGGQRGRPGLAERRPPVGVGRGLRDRRRHRVQPWVVVDVGDAELGGAGADARHQLGGGQRPAADVEEVGLAVQHGDAEDRQPLLRQPALLAAEEGEGLGDLRKRPGQRVPVDLAGGAGRQVVHQGQHRDHRRRQALGQPLPRRLAVEAGGSDQVADKDRDAGLGAPDGDGGCLHAGQRRQRGLDLAELDPPAADLHLVVRAAVEHQARVGQRHQVAGAVGPLPAERGQRRVLLGVPDGVEVAGQPDAADHQLAGHAPRHRLARRRRRRRSTSRPAAARCSPGSARPAGRRWRRRWPRSDRRCSTPRGPRPPGGRRAPAGRPRRRRSAAAPARAPRPATARRGSAPWTRR